MHGHAAIRADARQAIRWAFVLFLLHAALATTGVVFYPFAFYAGRLSFIDVLYAAFDVFILLGVSGALSRRQTVVVACGGLAIGFGILFSLDGQKYAFLAKLFAVLGGVGAASLAIGAYLAWRGSRAVRWRIGTISHYIVFFLLFTPLPFAALQLTALLHPLTYDAVAYRFDAALGFSPSVALGAIAASAAGFRELLLLTYAILPWGFALLYGLATRYPAEARFDLLRFWLLSAVAALTVYHFIPISGPAFLFGDLFPMKTPEFAQVAAEPTWVRAAARNAMPSMHFGWALAFWFVASLYRVKWPRALFAFILLLNGLATLALGEHYFVDLVVALPFTVAFLSLCVHTGQRAAQRRIAFQAGALALVWILLLRFGGNLAVLFPGVIAVAELLTVAIGVWLLGRLRMIVLPRAAKTKIRVAADAPAESAVRIVAIFIFSGFAGLVYEVVFSKALAFTFGSTALANNTVLATYMGGLALGAWLGGKLARRAANPIVAFAYCELAIGSYCLATPPLFHGLSIVYAAIATGMTPDALGLIFLRFVLGALVLLPPTLCMGMTLPLLAKHLTDRQEALGMSVAKLYGANTIGAALGALLSGYVMLPLLGITRTVMTAAVLNLLASLAALRIAANIGAQRRADVVETADDTPEHPLPHRSAGHVVLGILTLGGMVTLALEVNYIHLLAVVAGNSAYAFALMLFSFLVGLSAGSVLAKRLLKAAWPLPIQLAWLEAGLAISLLLTIFVWDDIPAYFASFAGYPMTRTFAAREFVRAAVSAAVMIPPALFIGAAYAVAIELLGRMFRQDKIAVLGRAMALNTVGNIAGVLLAGFVLLPTLGTLRSIQLLAAITALLGLSAAMLVRRQRVLAIAPLAVVGFLLAVQPASFDYTRLSNGANVYFHPQNFGVAIDHAESADGGLTTVTRLTQDNGQVLTTLLTNGKFQGNDSEEGEMAAQAGFALAPLLHTEARNRALVIGYGTGMSARTLLDAGFAALDIVELSADILKMANRHFEKINRRVSEAPGVNAYVTDGRNYLLLQPRKYDLISMEISSIWFAGASALYNREFYQLAKSRLEPQGVLQQWLQLHHMRGEDFLTVIATLRSEFRYVWLYLIGGQGVLVASNHPAAAPSLTHLRKIEQAPLLKSLMTLYGGSFESLFDQIQLDPAATDRLIAAAGVPMSYLLATDDNMRLEYGTPKGNVLDGRTSMEMLIDMMRRARIHEGP